MGEGNGTPLQYSCLENPMDGGAWWATVHGVAKSQTQLSDFTFTFKCMMLKQGTRIVSVNILIIYHQSIFTIKNAKSDKHSNTWITIHKW